MNEFIEQFIIECREVVEQATSALTTLENSPRDAQAVDALFRALHTLKGSAGIIDFVAMERLLHAVETELGHIRAARGQVPRKLNDDCVACLDLVVRWLDDMALSAEVPQGAESQAAVLLGRLDETARNAGAAANNDALPRAATDAAANVDTSDSALPPNARRLLEAQLALLEKLPADDAGFAGCVQAAGAAAANTLRFCKQEAVAERITQLTAQSLAVKDASVLRAFIDGVLGSAAAPVAAGAWPRAEITTRTLRIDAARIEQLVRLIGELTVVKNAIGHLGDVAQQQENPLAPQWRNQHAVLDRITSAVQETVLGMRVLPLRTVFGRFPAVIREMSAALGKPARLFIEGDETEADKAIVEMLFEPLLHVLRNAMDHGIESPETRLKNNKDAVATIIMRGSRLADRVLVEVSDDGAGIDVARVRDVALARGIIKAERLEEMDEAEIIALIFAAGFSTAARVTELSGRGVGMDAVRAAVGRFGGTVAIESHLNRGTTIRFSLPFSVMMTQVMTVEAGGQTFGIPLDAVVETIRVPGEAVAGVGASHAIVHRNRTLPVFELATLLQVCSAQATGTEVIIVVIFFAGQWGGIRIDKPGARMEVMLKPLEGLLSGMPGITGTTIMGDGRVLLVLDLAEILA